MYACKKTKVKTEHIENGSKGFITSQGGKVKTRELGIQDISLMLILPENTVRCPVIKSS